MRQIVGLCGLRGAGKDTAAKVLLAEGWQRVAFADKLYEEVAEAFGVTVAYLADRSIKELPQTRMALQYCQDDFFISVMLGLEPRGSISEMLTRPRSPREILQHWGTEYRRAHYGDDYWRQVVLAIIQANPGINYVVTDVRFPDEGKLVEDLGGVVGRITRPGQAAESAKDKALLHDSEIAMLDYPVKYQFINNDGPDGLSLLQLQVREAFLTGDVPAAVTWH